MQTRIPPYIHSFHHAKWWEAVDRPEWHAARQRTPEEDKAVDEGYARRADAIEAEMRAAGTLVDLDDLPAHVIVEFFTDFPWTG